MRFEGTNGWVEFHGDRIVIGRKGFANVLTQGVQGDKTVPLSSITAVQFRSAGQYMAGMIQFTLMGGREFRGGLMEATKDENAVLFNHSQEPAFAQLRDMIQAGIAGGHRVAASGTAAGVTDELTKLAELVDKGYLTRDEFDQRKAAILPSASAPMPQTAMPPAKVVASTADLGSPPSGNSATSPVEKGCLIIVAVVSGLLLLGSLSNRSEKPVLGEHWRTAGGLDDGQNFKFVEVDASHAKDGTVYQDAIKTLCGSGDCIQVAFFIAGDQIPPSIDRSTFFQSGGWEPYSPVALYFNDEFTQWDCERAGAEGAPLSALCGEGVKEQYGAVLALAARVGWTTGCGLPPTRDKQIVEAFASRLEGSPRKDQLLEAFDQMLTSSSNGPDDPADCANLRERIESKARQARKVLK